MAPRKTGDDAAPPRPGTDVYQRRSAPVAAPKATEEAPKGPPLAANAQQHWEKLIRRQRWSNRLFGAAFVVFFGAMVLSVLHIQRKKTEQALSSDTTPRRPPGPQGILLRTRGILEAERQGSLTFLVDDLREVNTRTEAPPGGAPLETTWIKLAGAELVKAERAMRETQPDRALFHFQRAADIFPDMKGVQAFIGLLHLQNQRFESAITHLGRAAAENPLDHSLINNLGVAHMALKKYADAERYFIESTRLSPKYPMGWYNLGSLYFEQEDHARAAAVLPTYLLLEGHNTEAAQMYARSLIALNRWREAAEVLGALATQQPGVAPVQFRLAQCLAMSGDTQGGLQALRRGTALLDRTQALAWLSRNDFNALREEPGFQELVSKLSQEK